MICYAKDEYTCGAWAHKCRCAKPLVEGRRWGIVQVDPSPNGVTIWVEPHEGEDRTQDPDEDGGESWTPVFATPAEAAQAIAQRPRYEVRELPAKVVASTAEPVRPRS